MTDDPSLKYREQHKLRLAYMPWLYWSLKPKQQVWARAWQKELQDYLQDMETVEIIGDVFIAPNARIFAERGRAITIRNGSFIAADTVLHGPISIGENVGINHHVTMDGGSKGIEIGSDCRIAAYCSLYAFNHRFEADRKINDQPVSSKGIQLGEDVWLGAHVGVVDGIKIEDGAVVGMNSSVTKNIEAYTVVAGLPVKHLKNRI